MDIFAGIDDSEDLFETNSRKDKRLYDLKETIRSYKPKIVYSKKILKENVNKNDLEESANLFKMRGDLFYFSKDYEKSAQSYLNSLDISTKSKSLNNTIFQRELNESIARCLLNMHEYEEAMIFISKLEDTAQNFESYSASLNLTLRYYENKDLANLFETILKDEYLTKICKLIYLHPLFVNLWIQLGDGLYKKLENNMNKDDDMINKIDNTDLIKYLKDCLLIVKELTKHGYMHRSDIVEHQKKNQKLWLDEMETKIKKISYERNNNIKNNNSSLNTNKQCESDDLSCTIENMLEMADKRDDNEKLNQSKCLDNFKNFKLWIII